MFHPHTIHLNHQSAKTGAYLCACFGCGAVFEYVGDTCNSSGCMETWKRKVAEYNGDAAPMGEKVEMPPLEPPASEDGAESNVIELPADSKANMDLD